MDQFAQSAYSEADVKKAGKVLGGHLLWTEETAAQIREAFAVANSWRESHAFPMRSIRHSAIHYMRESEIQGISAARLKRMKAIRAKLARPSLSRTPLSLHKLQDVGGCRLIVPTIDDVHRLTAILKDRLPHTLRSEKSYIDEPKDDGYRSQHLMYTYVGRKGRAAYDGRRIEVQIRTKLQHSWATTVEAVGLFRGEQLKNQKGSEDWLRLLALMSGEFAEIERCPLGANISAGRERRHEIRELAASLDALRVLDGVAHGFRGADVPLTADYRPSHYLIRFDHATRTVHVEPCSKSRAATLSYDVAEASDNQTGNDTQDVVLVEVDKIDNLKAAYPNYFGDVRLFGAQLRRITVGQSALDYSAVEREPRMPDTRKPIDLSWLRGSRFGRPG